MSKLVGYLKKTMSHRQTVRECLSLNHLVSKEQTCNYMAYRNIIKTLSCLEIKTLILQKLMLMKMMQRSNIYHIKEN